MLMINNRVCFLNIGWLALIEGIKMHSFGSSGYSKWYHRRSVIVLHSLTFLHSSITSEVEVSLIKVSDSMKS